MYSYALIPLIVSACIALLSSAWLTMRVLEILGSRRMFVISFLFLVYGLLAWAAVEFKIIENALATVLTLSAALISRTLTLSESFSEYKRLLHQPGLTCLEMKGKLARFIEIMPDIILVVLLLVLARDIREKYEIREATLILLYLVEMLYAAVLFAYVGLGDLTGDLIEYKKNVNKQKTDTGG